MARTFTKNTANYMTLGTGVVGTLLGSTSKVSVAIRAKLSAITGGDIDNRLFTSHIDANLRALVFNINNSGTSPVFRAGARSTAADSFAAVDGTTVIGTGVWHVYGVTIDFTAKTLVGYLDGVQEMSGSSLGFGSNTFTLGTPTNVDMIGADTSAPTTSDMQAAGDIAEFMVWTDALTADQHKLVGKFLRSPFKVRRDALVLYTRLTGSASPEPSLVGGLNGTITGSVPAAVHPYVKL